jgi:hypothetical protein
VEGVSVEERALRDDAPRFRGNDGGRGLMSDDATLMPNLQALHDYVAGLHRAFTLDE